MRMSYLFLLALLGASPVVAQPAAISVTLNGHVVPEARPLVVQHRVLVPIRSIFEQLGAQVDYHASTRVVTIHRNKSLVSLGVLAPLAFINGQQVRLEVAPQVIDDRVMVPLRFVSEALGARVRWTPITMTVAITTPDHIVVDQRLTPVQVAAPPAPSIEDPYLVTGVFFAPPVIPQGDIATVQVSGIGGGVARFNVQGQTVPMSETSPGVYLGTFRAADIYGDQRPQIQLSGPNGETTTQRAIRPIPIQGPWTPGQPVIARVETNGSDPLHPGQRLLVAAEGTPGGRASFSLGHYIFPMLEGRPGKYRGEYIVQPGDVAIEARIRVTLSGATQGTTVDVMTPANLISP